MLIVWAGISAAELVPASFFTGPGEVVGEFASLVERGILPAYLGDSIGRLLIGSAVGLAVGIGLGFLIGLNRYVRKFLWPLLLFFQAIGDIAWLPILVIWFGFSITSVTIVIVYTVMFPLIIAIVSAIDGMPVNLLRASGSLGADRWSRLVYVILPGTLPGVSSGIRTGLGYGLRALIAAEMIIGTSGVGFMMFDARGQGDVAKVFVGMVVLGVLWYLVDALILAPFERETVERWGMVEGVGR
ncbi:ABC transporter permease [Microbacterium jiangjiandongii]|uniref:ABC transporter permease n=1 Tax=Microbacterium jiangjiandongii TaxID=3049071 RepID=UPI00214C887B|nr:ABC transporter permease [Microbacterium sp. zg.Y843]MCR2815016.1 ABC transporter permease [Microbacterium sp. zg.Y843]